MSRSLECLFFLSGAAGLSYEVLWTRRLTLTFGHTVWAVTTVLTLFMLGLGAGAWLGGRWSVKRAEHGLRAYGWLELFVAAWGVASLPLLSLVDQLHLRLSASGYGGLGLAMVDFAASSVALLPPTLAMGASFPVLTRWLARAWPGAGQLVSRLYGWNTAGAALGAGLSGLVLLPTIGLECSLIATAILGLGIGATALGLSTMPAPEGGSHWPEQATRPLGSKALLLAILFLTGTASMIDQVAWTRGLILTIGSSIYAFCIILMTFLACLALGSLVFGLLCPYVGRVGGAALGWTQLALGTASALTVVLLGYLPLLFLIIYNRAVNSFQGTLLLELGLAAAALAPACLLMGLAFPLANHLYAGGPETVGRSLGDLYAADTVGCIVGAFVTGFFMVPGLGVESSLKVAVGANLLAALLAFGGLARWRPGRLLGGGLTLAVGLSVALVPIWNPAIMSAGMGIYCEQFRGRSVSDALRLMEPPTFYKDGLSTTVSVHITGPDRMSLRVNGKTDASLYKVDELTMYLLGYLGGMLHPSPKSAAVIGLGSGMSLDALTQIAGMRRIDCAELEPAMVQANRYWTPYNHHVLADPRVKVHIADGRTFVEGSPRHYDLILSEPSNPWIAGVANLYTLDFYRACRRKLNPGGLMIQWVQIYGLTRSDLGMVCHTFYDAFPHGSVWFAGPADLLLVGSARPVRVDMARIRTLYHKSAALRKEWFHLDMYSPAGLLGHFFMDRAEILAGLPSDRINTDDRPLLEFTAPISLRRMGNYTLNLDMLLKMQLHSFPDGIRPTRAMQLAAANSWVDLGDRTRAQALLAPFRGSWRAFALLGRLAHLEHRRDLMELAFRTACSKAPKLQGAAIGLLWAAAEVSDGRPADAVVVCRQSLACTGPHWFLRGHALTLLGEAALRAGMTRQAITALRQAVGAPLPDPRTVTLLGMAYAKAGHFQRARRTFALALRHNPYDPAARLGLAQIAFDQAQLAKALQLYRKVLVIMPRQVAALTNLGVCEARLGHRDRAITAFEKALDQDPDSRVARRDLVIVRTSGVDPAPRLRPLTPGQVPGQNRLQRQASHP